MTAQCVEGLPCDDDLYKASPQDVEWFEQHNSNTVRIMPIIGNDGKLLGVTIGGITLERPDDMAWDYFAETVLSRILILPRDTESQEAKILMEKDDDRIAALKRM